MYRKKFVRTFTFATLLALLAVVASGCGDRDPKEKILQDRARWNVAVQSWSQGEDGTVTIGARLSGPPNSKLAELTVRVKLVDSESEIIETVWHTFDLSDVQRGGPADKIVRVREFPQEVFGAGIDPVLAPTAEEQAQISELQP
jgi:hypothetical protein